MSDDLFERADEFLAVFRRGAEFTKQLVEENLRLDRIDHETELEKYGPFLQGLGSLFESAMTFDESLGVMILDVDNYKTIVNTYGYDASKQFLHELGGLVRSVVRSYDLAARYGPPPGGRQQLRVLGNERACGPRGGARAPDTDEPMTVCRSVVSVVTRDWISLARFCSKNAGWRCTRRWSSGPTRSSCPRRSGGEAPVRCTSS